MRDIKFRAWCPFHNHWFSLRPDTDAWYGADNAGKDNHHLAFRERPTKDMCYDYRLKNIKLYQYTGLKDTSFTPVEVCEGDILGINKRGELEAVGEVIFDTDLAQYTVKYTNGGWAELWQHLNEKTNEGREVIGNIYENPELLRGK